MIPKTHLSDTKGESIATSTAFGGIINGLELHLEKPRENGRFKVFLPACHRQPKLKEASIRHSRLESQDFRALFYYPCLPTLLVLFALLQFSSFAVFFSPRSRFVLPNLLVCCFLSVICCQLLYVARDVKKEARPEKYPRIGSSPQQKYNMLGTAIWIWLFNIYIYILQVQAFPTMITFTGTNISIFRGPPSPSSRTGVELES